MTSSMGLRACFTLKVLEQAHLFCICIYICTLHLHVQMRESELTKHASWVCG